MEGILDWGIEVIKAIQTIECAPLTFIANIFHTLFNSAVYIAVIAIVYWGIDTKKGFKLGSVLLFSASVNSVIKDNCKVPRPFLRDPSVGRAVENSWSFPSGHAQAAATFWPLFSSMQKSWKKWLKLLVGILLPLLIAFSRMYLGVHYPTDVGVGLIIGFLLTACVILFWDRIAKLVKPLNKMIKILIAAIVSFILNSLDMQDPSMSAALFGFTTGYILISEKGSFSASQGSGLQKSLRICLGGALVAGIAFGLKALFPGADSEYYVLFRFIRYMVVGFTTTFIAPKLFVILKLAVPVSKAEDVPEKVEKAEIEDSSEK